MKDVKYVLVWGTSARHNPQHCGLSHVLQDEDVVQIVKKKVRKTTRQLVFYSILTSIFTSHYSLFQVPTTTIIVLSLIMRMTKIIKLNTILI